MEYKLDNDKNRMRYKPSLSSMEVAFIIHKGHDDDGRMAVMFTSA